MLKALKECWTGHRDQLDNCLEFKFRSRVLRSWSTEHGRRQKNWIISRTLLWPVTYAENFRGVGQVSSHSCDVTNQLQGKCRRHDISRGVRGRAPGKMLQNYTWKYTFLCILEARFRQFCFYIFFRIWGGCHGTVASTLRTLVAVANSDVVETETRLKLWNRD